MKRIVQPKTSITTEQIYGHIPMFINVRETRCEQVLVNFIFLFYKREKKIIRDKNAANDIVF